MEIEARPEVLQGCTIRVRSPFGTVFVTLNEKTCGCPYEIFVNVGKSGSDITAEAEAIGRLCTLLLRIPSAVPAPERVQTIVHHLVGIGGSHRIQGADGNRSLADSVASALKQYLSYRWLRNQEFA